MTIDITLRLNSAEYQQRLAAAASGTGRFGQILSGVARVVGDVEDRMTFAAAAADDLARRIEPQTDGFDRLRSNVEALSDRLKIFGERGNQMASAIEGISDPVRRATLAQREFDRLQNPDRLTRMATAANDMQAELDLLAARLGPLAPLAAGAALAIGGTLVAAVEAYAATNRLAQRDIAALEGAVGRLARALGELVYEGGEAGGVMQGLATGADNAADLIGNIREESDGLAGAIYDLGEAWGDAYQIFAWVFAAPVMVGMLALEEGIDALVESGEELPWVWGQVDTLTDSLDALKDKVGETADAMRDDFGAAIDNTVSGFQRLAAETNAAIDAIRWDQFARSTPLARGGKAGPLMPTGEFDTGFREGPLTQEGRFEGERREKRGGGKKKDASEVAGGLRSVLGLAQELSAVQMPTFEGTGVTLEQLALTLKEAGLIEQLTQTGDALYEITRQLEEGFAGSAFQEGIADALAMKEAMDRLADGIENGAVDAFASLADASFRAFGAFAVGEGSLKGLGDAMMDTIGDIAGSFGDLFLKAGAGMVFFDPLVGAGLIGAGLALKVGAGAASAKGSGNAGSGSSSAAREVERLADRLSRDRAEEGRAVAPQVLVIGDKEFRGYLYQEIRSGTERRQLAA